MFQNAATKLVSVPHRVSACFGPGVNAARGKRTLHTPARGTMASAASAREPPRTRDETLDVLFDISQLLNTGVDRATLNVLVGLTESGVNPEALAAVVKELRRESAALESSSTATLPSTTTTSRAATEAAAFAPPRSYSE